MTARATLQPPPAYSAQGGSSPSPVATVAYGPTPIVAYYPHQAQSGSSSAPVAVAYLPYYDPSSQYSLERAEYRARRRFFGALLWAVVVYVLTGIMFGSFVVEIKHGHRRW